MDITPRHTTPTTHPPRHLVLAIVTSVATVLAAAWWLVHPASTPFASEDSALLRAVLEPGQTSAVLLALGLLGGILSAAAALTPSARGALTVPAAGLAVATLGVHGLSVMAYTGYLVAFALPALLVLIAAQAILRGGPGRRIAAVSAATVVAALAAAGLLSGDAWVIVTKVAPSFIDSLPEMLSSYLVLALTISWGLVAVRSDVHSRLESWTVRHRRTLTVLAALGPVRYAATRLSWLTPWPFLAPEDLAADMRLWGLLLAGGAWLGVVLTIGLIRPWGEVFPRWMPVVAGRRVPVWCAAAPGGFVAAAVTAAALPILTMAGGEAASWQVAYAFLMPFWAWGPLLGLAVWGYVLHRRDGSVTDGSRPQPDVAHRRVMA